MAESWTTYAEAAQILGMKVEGVRQRARREGWRRTMGNDKKALVMIPEDARTPTGDAPGNRPNGKPDTTRTPGRTPPPQNSAEIIALQERIEELKADLGRERGERREQQDRADRLSSELANMAKEMTRVVQEGAARERDLSDKLYAAKHSTWWPFQRAK